MKKITELAISNFFDFNLLRFIDRCFSIYNSLVDDVTFSEATDIELFNGWINYGEPFAPAKCFKNNQGIVILQGTVKSGSITSGVVIGRLPVGYYPKYQKIMPVSCNASASIARIDVRTNGELVLYGAGGSTYLSLDNIQYLV